MSNKFPVAFGNAPGFTGQEKSVGLYKPSNGSIYWGERLTGFDYTFQRASQAHDGEKMVGNDVPRIFGRKAPVILLEGERTNHFTVSGSEDGIIGDITNAPGVYAEAVHETEDVYMGTGATRINVLAGGGNGGGEHYAIRKSSGEVSPGVPAVLHCMAKTNTDGAYFRVHPQSPEGGVEWYMNNSTGFDMTDGWNHLAYRLPAFDFPGFNRYYTRIGFANETAVGNYIILDNVQMEQGEFASSFIPTPSDATVTRAADLLTITNLADPSPSWSDFNIAGWFDATRTGEHYWLTLGKSSFIKQVGNHLVVAVNNVPLWVEIPESGWQCVTLDTRADETFVYVNGTHRGTIADRPFRSPDEISYGLATSTEKSAFTYLGFGAPGLGIPFVNTTGGGTYGSQITSMHTAWLAELNGLELPYYV